MISLGSNSGLFILFVVLAAQVWIEPAIEPVFSAREAVFVASEVAGQKREPCDSPKRMVISLGVRREDYARLRRAARPTRPAIRSVAVPGSGITWASKVTTTGR